MGRLIDEAIEEYLKWRTVIARNVSGHCLNVLDAFSNSARNYYQLQDQYEQRLKADMVAMLEEIDLQFDEICFYKNMGEWKTVPEIKAEYKAVIQQKINALKIKSEELGHEKRS